MNIQEALQHVRDNGATTFRCNDENNSMIDGTTFWLDNTCLPQTYLYEDICTEQIEKTIEQLVEMYAGYDLSVEGESNE